MQDDFDDYELEEIAEQVQMGTAAEGAEALGKLVKHARGSGQGTRQAVRQELATMQLEREHQAALKEFAEKYPQLKDDEILAEAGRSALRKEIVEDLRGLGIEEEKLASVRDIGLLAAAHGEARLSGMKVRTPTKLLDDTGAELSRKFNIQPARAERHTPERVVRQMRESRGFQSDEDLPARAEVTEAEKDRRQRNLAAFNQMRQSRGYTTVDFDRGRGGVRRIGREG